jgi:predicted amidohydrolase
MKVAGVSFDISRKFSEVEDWVHHYFKINDHLVRENHQFIVYPELMFLALSQFYPKLSGKEQLKAVHQAVRDQFLPQFIKKMNKREGVVILGSTPWEEGGKIYNRSLIYLNGELLWQDKLYLTPWEKDFSTKEELKIFDYKGIRFVVLTCFDIEQPFLSYQLKSQNIHMILCPYATESMLGSQRVLRCASARAVELGVAVLAVPLLGSSLECDLISSNEGQQGFFLPSQEKILAEKVDLSDYRARGDFFKSYSLRVEDLMKIKNPSEETKPFFTEDPKSIIFANLN